MFEKLSELGNTKDALKDQIKAIEALTEMNPITEEDIIAAISDIHDLVSTKTNREVQLALESMIVRNTIYDDRIEATFKVAFLFLNTMIKFWSWIGVFHKHFQQVL